MELEEGGVEAYCTLYQGENAQLGVENEEPAEEREEPAKEKEEPAYEEWKVVEEARRKEDAGVYRALCREGAKREDEGERSPVGGPEAVLDLCGEEE